MASNELKKYIQESLAHGKTSEDIKRDLLGTGWQEADISKAFYEMGTIKKSTILLLFQLATTVFLSLFAIFYFQRTKHFLFFEYINAIDELSPSYLGPGGL